MMFFAKLKIDWDMVDLSACLVTALFKEQVATAKDAKQLLYDGEPLRETPTRLNSKNLLLAYSTYLLCRSVLLTASTMQVWVDEEVFFPLRYHAKSPNHHPNAGSDQQCHHKGGS